MTLKQEDVIDRFKLVHIDRYDYSLVEYTGYGNKVKIICHIHGIFEQSPDSHLRGAGCPKCAGRNKTTEELVIEFVNVHGDRYDYSLVEYKARNEKVSIICHIHGIFEQKPYIHLQGCGCPKCAGLYKTTEELIKEFNLVHKNKYNYSLVEYKGCNEKVSIICSIHGIFEQSPTSHLSGRGCPKCPKTSFNLLEFYRHHPKGQELGNYYQIRLFNENESFYKRGITCRSITERFSKLNQYEYEIIDDLTMTNLETAEQESFDEIRYKYLSYNPHIKFDGYKECYTEKILMVMDYNL